VHGGGGGTRCWSSRGGGGDSSEPEGSPGRVAWFALRVAAGAACALAAAASLPAYDTRPFSAAFTHDTTALPVCVVIPALNEQAVLESTLRCVAALRPPPAAVVVAVGPSTDRTARLARAYGATVVTGGRGRSVQMNAGASAALSSVRPATPAGSAERAPPPPAALLFVHADTRLPPDAVALVRGALAQPRVVAGGFVSLLESPHCTWWAQSFHNSAHTVTHSHSSLLSHALSAPQPSRPFIYPRSSGRCLRRTACASCLATSASSAAPTCSSPWAASTSGCPSWRMRTSV